MSFDYAIHDDEDTIVVSLSFSSVSSVEFPFLDDGNFLELELGFNTLKAKIRKNSYTDKQLEKGVIINGIPYQLQNQAFTKFGHENFVGGTKPPHEVLEEPETYSDVCLECNSKNLIYDYDRGEVVCGDCGLYQRKIIDLYPEWRAFDLDERLRRSRVGPPLTQTIHDKGLGSEIGRKDKDADGRNLTLTQKYLAYKLRKWQKRTRISNSEERTLARGLSEINRISEKLNLNKQLTETAAVMYRKVTKRKITRGVSVERATAATVYITKRKLHGVTTLQEIVDAVGNNLNKKSIIKCVKLFHKKGLIDNMGVQKPEDFVKSYISKLEPFLSNPKIVQEVCDKALKEMRKNIKLKQLLLRDPRSPATALIYIGCKLSGNHLTQRKLAELSQLTGVTIRSRYKEILERLYFEVKL